MPAVKSKAKRAKPTAGKPIVFEQRMTIRGGHLKTAAVIPIDVAQHSGAEVRFTHISHRTPWLCEMVSGVRQWSSPLKGASMVRRLKRLMAEASATAVLPAVPLMDDKMAGLLGSDDELPIMKPPATCKKSKVEAEEPTVIVVTVPPPATAEGQIQAHKVLLLRCSDRELRIDINALPWLVEQMQMKVNDNDEHSHEEAVVRSTPFWDFAKDAWSARVRRPDGQIVRRMQSVKDRMGPGKDLCDISFAEAKQRVAKEVSDWISDAQSSSDASSPPQIGQRGRRRMSS